MSSEPVLVLKAKMPVRVTTARPGYTAEVAFENNLKIFQIYDVLDERAAKERSEADSPLSSELKRLDLKIGLLLELMIELTHRGDRRAQLRDVELDFRGVTWTDEGALPVEVGSSGRIELFVNPDWPQPLVFHGSFVSANALKDRVRFEFDALTEAEGDQLERLIFKHHRRAVADGRRAQGNIGSKKSGSEGSPG